MKSSFLTKMGVVAASATMLLTASPAFAGGYRVSVRSNVGYSNNYNNGCGSHCNTNYNSPCNYNNCGSSSSSSSSNCTCNTNSNCEHNCPQPQPQNDCNSNFGCHRRGGFQFNFFDWCRSFLGW